MTWVIEEAQINAVGSLNVQEPAPNGNMPRMALASSPCVNFRWPPEAILRHEERLYPAADRLSLERLHQIQNGMKCRK